MRGDEDMAPSPEHSSTFREYLAWDSPTRWFHWINALTVLGLIATGLMILTENQLGISAEGKVALKSVHVSFGYVMAINLLWRFVWAFFGNRYARWRAILPGGQGFTAAVRAYVASFLTGEPQQYVGHNPLARIGVTLLLVLLLIQVVTGVVLAGTDLYWPPFGSLFAEWIAAPGVDPGTIQPGATDLMDKAAYQSMRDFRGPFVEVHEIVFYVLAAAIVLHIVAVVVTELREGGSITSAMFTGRKILTRKPQDAP
jgi:Ni/Fe-hydrogenase 1 B-type cytochrome subunit